MEALNHPLLAPYKDQILATAKPSAAITLTRQDEGLTLWQSKVGGDPYLPKGADYPRHPDGHALTLLAQINFAEVPKLPDFPEKGILQFFIDGTDETFGRNDDNLRLQDGFRVVYYADVSEKIDDLVTDFLPYAVEIYEYGLPFKGQYAMAFRGQSMSSDDSPKGHRIGGYPWFTQDDPRDYSEFLAELLEDYALSPNNDKALEDYILLFQLDSEWGKNWEKIVWGDDGVGNFFIHPDDLKNLDFSKVMYTWDCC